jgi:hypothetical protein
MTHRFAIYYAPGRDSALAERADAWLARPELETVTGSARRYGFHATLKAPMEPAADEAELDAALLAFADEHAPVALTGLAPRLLEGFLALTLEPQPEAVTALAAEVATAFEPFRAPLSASERERRLRAPLTPRQIELVDAYGYPYVLEEFRFHMTISDRLPSHQQEPILDEARDWFGDVLATPPVLDRLVLFEEPEPGAAFRRLEDYPLMGGQ